MKDEKCVVGDAPRHLGVRLEFRRGTEARSNMEGEETGWDRLRSTSPLLRATLMSKEEVLLVELGDDAVA